MQERALEDGKILLVLHPGDEVHTELAALAERRSLEAATISAIGAVGELEIGYYCIPKQDYDRKVYRESVEVISISGNLARLDGKPISHLHGVFSGPDMAAFGGHVFRAVCSVTVEMFVTAFPVALERRRDERFKPLALLRW
jgi:predicted DNA-binding protein with PD1-like motif